MKKNIALMALTGILTLASCTQSPDGNKVDTTVPTVTLTANPNSLASAGGSVVLSGTATDADSGVASVVITRNDGTTACTPTVSSTGAFSCTVSLPANTGTSAMNYTYTAKATDKATTPNTATAMATVTVNAPGGNGGPVTTTHTLTVNLTGVGASTVTIKDATTGAIMAGYSNGPIGNGGKVVLPAGKYIVTAGTLVGYNGPTPASVTVDLTSVDGTATFAYTAKPATSTEAYYVDANGNRVYLNFANGFDRSKFRFNAWLEDETGGINAPAIDKSQSNGGAMATEAEKLEYAPLNHQNIVGSYMEYNDNGTWRPVVGAQVEMNIQPESQNGLPVIRFTAADDVNRTTPPLTGQDISSNGLSSRSWTNASGAYETNPVYYPGAVRDPSTPSAPNGNYPYYNVTGVSNPIVPGYSWAALMNDPQAVNFAEGVDYLQARIQVVGYVNGNEVEKHWVTKRFIPQAKVEIRKELLAIDPATRTCTVALDKTGVIPTAGTAPVYLPGQEACIRITVSNTGDAIARNINFGESWLPLNARPDTYSIGMTPQEYARTTAAGNGQIRYDGTPVTDPTVPGQPDQVTPSVKFADERFSGTIVSLAPKTSQTITFFARGINNGTYCDIAQVGAVAGKLNLTDYLNNPDPVTGAYRLVANYGQQLDQVCFTVQGQSKLEISKTITYTDNNPVDTGTTANRNQWVNVTVRVHNNGTQVANNVMVQDRLNASSNAAAHEISISPATTGMTTPTAAQGNDGLDFTIPKLQAGQELVYTYRARANADGTYCDTASITSVDGSAPNPAKNSSACFTVAMAELTIQKNNVPSEGVLPGELYTSNISVKNIGTSSAYEVNVFDLLGISQAARPTTRVEFVNGRYIITTDQGLPINGVPRGVINAGETGIDPNRQPVLLPPYNGINMTPAIATTLAPTAASTSVVTAPPVDADQYGVTGRTPTAVPNSYDGQPHGIVIPAGGSLTLTVVSRIPLDAPLDSYCDTAVVTANTSNLVSAINRARACTTIKHILAVQTQLEDTTDPITKGGNTLFTGTFFNERQSTEAAANNLMTFTVPTHATLTGQTMTVSGISVYYDTNPTVATTGVVVYNPLSATLQNITATSTVSAISGGKFTVKPNRNIPVGAAVFVVYTGTASATAAEGSYNSTVVWTSNGAISGNAKSDNSAEDTTVR